MLKMLDLFSGIGGFSLAAKWAGIETIAFCEKDPFCQKVLKKHWPHVPIFDDIKTLEFNNRVDLITGGFPCQPFSIAGKRKGKDDNRYLWPEFLRIIRESQPSWIIAENVTGIVAMEFDNIIADLESENYTTATFIIPACAAYAPHRRDRVWIVAHANSERCDSGANHRKIRSIQENLDRNMASLQSQWEKLKPEPWKIMCARDFLLFNANACRNHDGVSNRLDRLKALGNAIVPQVVFPILATIVEIERTNHNGT